MLGYAPLDRGGDGGKGDDVPVGKDACGAAAGGRAELSRLLPALCGGGGGDEGAVGAEGGGGFPVLGERRFLDGGVSCVCTPSFFYILPHSKMSYKALEIPLSCLFFLP